MTEQQQLSLEMDSSSPFSYLEWKERNFNSSVAQYNKYVTDWFNKNKSKPLSKKFLIRQKYLYMLSQLQMFFSDEESQNWYSKINLADENELLLGIPYFAKKLKEIALYYLKLRNKLKNTKLKYNLVGTKRGLELEIQQKLFETFSTLNKELPPSLRSTVGTPDHMLDKLNVEIEELYDDTVYFDRSTTAPLSTYVDLFHPATAELFATKGLNLSSDGWIFNSLSIPSADNIDTFIATVTGNIFETSDEGVYRAFLEKFLGSDKITTVFDSISSIKVEAYIPLLSGNNRFYWPGTMIDQTIKLDFILDPVPLSAIIPDGGNASQTIDGADTIFVKKGTSFEGAWLRYKEFDTTKTGLEAHVKANKKTSFIFPYPGYGLSAEDIEWTGNSLSATYEYDFLSEDLKNSVHTRYWTQELPIDTTTPVIINNTSLALEGSYPNKNPNYADQVYLARQRPRNVLDTPGLEEQASWLYKFDRTSIPVISELVDSFVLMWPYEYIDQNEPFPTQFKNYDFENICEPVSIQDLDVPFVVAGSTFASADKIYKLGKYSDSFENALECCWLSGQTFSTDSHSWTSQQGFSSLFTPGTPARFIWTGTDNTPLSSVFTSIQHSSDCPFVTKENVTDPNECTCKQVYYSCYGHNGETFDKFNSRADYILIDNGENPSVEFDLGSWLDSKKQNSNTSDEFAWFQTTTKQTWGDNGKWVSGKLETQPFNLRTGQRYVFYRTNSRDETVYPIYSVNFKYPTNIGKTKWIQAKRTEAGDWTSADIESQTKLYAGDLIKWQRLASTTHVFLSSIDIETETKNLSSLWAVYDQISLNSSLLPSTTLNFPFVAQVTSDAESTSQVPILSTGRYINFQDVAQVYWWKITNTSIPSSTPLFIYDDIAPTFTPKLTGTYFVEVSASINTQFSITTAGFEQLTQDVYFNQTTIPPIYVLPTYIKGTAPIEIQTPSSGFLIEQPLYGWNYNTKTYDKQSFGAKPYWATLFFDKNESTRNKGLYVWGYQNRYLNNYIPNFSPKVSDIELNYGNVFSYVRNGGSFIWSQPIEFKKFVGETEWCQITATPTTFGSLSSLYFIGTESNPSVFPTLNPTPIMMTNYDNGQPVEVVYNSTSTFDWLLSVDVPLISDNSFSVFDIQTVAPWSVLSNRFNPTIATLPDLSKLYSEKQVGGYFVADNLGASQYINKNFIPVPLSSLNTVTVDTENVFVHIGGQGLTKQDQNTFYTWTEDNRWVKEPPTTNELVGAVKKSLSKTLQSFVPYQASNSLKQLGLNNTTDQKSPWGGINQSEWTDKIGYPANFSGVHSVSAWHENKLIQQAGKVMDQWSHDIYGNHFGLFKSALSSTYGQLWVRTPNETTLPSAFLLSAVYDPIKNLSLTVYNDLVGNGIKNIDCYGDTLMVQTSGALIFAKLSYDYSLDKILSTLDDIKYINLFSLLSGASAYTVTPNQQWYFSDKNKIIVSTTTLSANQIFPELYELNLETNSFVKQIPADPQEQTLLTQTLSSLNVISVDEGLLTYNKSLQQYLLTVPGILTDNTPFIVDLLIDERQYYTITDVSIYKQFDTQSPPYLSGFEAQRNITMLSSFAFVLPSTESITSVQLINAPVTVTASLTNNNQAVLISGNFASVGLDNVICNVSNSVGANQFPLNFNILPVPTATPTLTPTPLPTSTPGPTSTPLPTPVPLRYSLSTTACTDGTILNDVVWLSGGETLCSAILLYSSSITGLQPLTQISVSDGVNTRNGVIEFISTDPNNPLLGLLAIKFTNNCDLCSLPLNRIFTINGNQLVTIQQNNFITTI